VRKVEHTMAEVQGFAASIAANGILQNLVVKPTRPLRP
jgi:ParB family chromosome partitioning protein